MEMSDKTELEAKAEALFEKHWGKYNQENEEILLSVNFQNAMIAAIIEAMDKPEDEADHNPNVHNLDITYTGVCRKCGGTNLMDAPSPTQVEAMGKPEGVISVDQKYPDIGLVVLVWIEEVQTWVKLFYNGQRWINMECMVLPEYYQVKYWMPIPSRPTELKYSPLPEAAEVYDFEMTELLLTDRIIDLTEQHEKTLDSLQSAKNEKQKAALEKALANIQGWMKEFSAARKILKNQKLK